MTNPPYIKPTIFSGDWTILKYDTTPINYYQVSSNFVSSIANIEITHSPSAAGNDLLSFNSYSFNRKRSLLEDSSILLPGPINKARVNEFTDSRWSSSAMDILYNSDFYYLQGVSSLLRVEVAKRTPFIFSIQFSSINNNSYIPLIIRPFGAAFGFNSRISENACVGTGDAYLNRENINGVSGVHQHNPTFDSHNCAVTPYLLPEDRQVSLGIPLYSAINRSPLTPSSMQFIGAVRPFDFVSTSAENQGSYDQEKGGESFSNPAFWQSLIQAQDYYFNWLGLEGVHKIKYYYYNNKDLLGVSSGQHAIQMGPDLYFTNTFNKGYLYMPDSQTTYDLNTYKFRPSVTGTHMFGTATDTDYSGLFTSGGVFQVQYICNSAMENTQAPYIIDQAQGLWHQVFQYNWNGGGNIFADQGKNVAASSHPYFSSLFGSDPAAYFASGFWAGWNADPAYPLSIDPRYGAKSGRGKQYVCPIAVLDSDNLFGTTSKVCVGLYTKLSYEPEVNNRANRVHLGVRREQLKSVFNQTQYYRPATPSSFNGGTNAKYGPFTFEDLNGGTYMNLFSTNNKNFAKGWHMLEFWLVIGETKNEVISKINTLHQMGVAEPGPSAPEIELPQAILNSVLMNPVRGTI